MLELVAAALAAAATPSPLCRGVAEPVIDVHLHAYEGDIRFVRRTPNPRTGEPSAATDGASHRRLTLLEMERLGIVRGLVSSEGFTGPAEKMVAASGGRVLLGFGRDEVPTSQDLAQMRALAGAGKLALLGEIAPQYAGVAPDDPRMEPFWALAEQLQIPVGYHMGSGPALITQQGAPAHRAALGRPLLIEDVLVRHPRLRIFIMHAGWPFADEIQALLNSYPNVYADLGAIHWYENRKAFHAYLKRLVDEGFGKRIMFGSDQMVWPEAIGESLQAYREADYLTSEQRRDILFNNAVRFFGWSDLAGCGAG
jgi:predicted TIM-barrel fold metal-dependent hydrolase